jgi:hypothetical protein
MSTANPKRSNEAITGRNRWLIMSSFIPFLRYRHEGVRLLPRGYTVAPNSTIGDEIAWSYGSNRLNPAQRNVLAGRVVGSGNRWIEEDWYDGICR